mgnify:CR=1 FL=1
MSMTRRQLLRNGLALGAAVPAALSTGMVGQAMAAGLSLNGEIQLFGFDRSTTELGRGLQDKGWKPVDAGRFDPLALTALPGGSLAAGFTDEAGLALLTSQLVGRGRILALGRHGAGRHQLVSQRGPITASLTSGVGSWQAALGREYARLAEGRPTARHVRNLLDQSGMASNTSELSFLVRV